MLKKPSDLFTRLLNYIDRIPVVDCHEHLRGPERDLQRAPKRDPILALIVLYLISDLWSAGATNQEIELLQSQDASLDEKWPVFQRLWTATEHTAYARVAKLVLREAYGVTALTRESLERVAGQLASRDPSYYLQSLHDAGIRAVIAEDRKSVV